MNENLYEEIETENNVYDEDLSVGDYTFISTMAFTCCVVIAFLCWQIRKTFKNIHLKIGDKVEVGVETKDVEKKRHNKKEK